VNRLRIEVLDSMRGCWATGMRVDVFALGAGARKLCSGVVNAEGVVDEPALAEALGPGEYEVVFHVGRFFGEAGERPERPRLDTVPFRFSVAGNRGYRLPVRIAPWEFALDRCRA
jgi:5-hydroxyisourate hydrolase